MSNFGDTQWIKSEHSKIAGQINRIFKAFIVLARVHKCQVVRYRDEPCPICETFNSLDLKEWEGR